MLIGKRQRDPGSKVNEFYLCGTASTTHGSVLKSWLRLAPVHSPVNKFSIKIGTTQIFTIFWSRSLVYTHIPI